MKLLLSFLTLLIIFSSCNSERELESSDYVKKNLGKIRWYGVNNSDSIKTRGVADESKLWNPKTGITIKFINNPVDANMILKIKTIASEWEEYAGIKFNYVENDKNASIRIAFDWNGNDWLTWSYTGTDAKYVRSQSEPTVVFGGLQYQDEEQFKGDVLRVFGQILGLEYEQRHQDWSFWRDEIKLQRYWEDLFDGVNMDWNEIRDYVFTPLTGDNAILPTQTTEIDELSIMAWAYYARNQTTKLLANYELSDGDKAFIQKLYPGHNTEKKYINGYEHNLVEPNWAKLKTINNLIGGTRDIEGNYYFYPYGSGNIVKYNDNLDNNQLIGVSNVNYRIAPRIIPTDGKEKLVRRGYNANITYLFTNQTHSSEKNQPISQTTPYGALIYDYDRELIYHSRRVFDINFKEIGEFLADKSKGYGGILYWGKKYKWAALTYNHSEAGMGEDVTFFAYEHSANSMLLSEDNLVTKITVPDFKIRNGGFPTVYEYNDKLVVVNFGGTGWGLDSGSMGSILIIDPSGKIDPKKYKVYMHKDAQWRQSTSINHLCGGFYWRHKIMVYDEMYNKYYFEFPELMN